MDQIVPFLRLEVIFSWVALNLALACIFSFAFFGTRLFYVPTTNQG